MILIGIGQTKNEQDIIEPWVRHHLKLLDVLIVFDGSHDETKRILSSLAEEFSGQLFVEHEQLFGDRQQDSVTSLLRSSARHRPDYVFPLDADELINCRQRRELEVHLSEIPNRGAGKMPWRTYVWTEHITDSPRDFAWYRKQELPQYSKVVLHTSGVNLDDRLLFKGCHEVGVPSGRGVEYVEFPIQLLHFPIRSREQFVSKTVVNWIAAKPFIRNQDGFQRKQGFDSITKGNEIRDTDLFHLSRVYAQQSLPDLVCEPPNCFDYERRYSDGSVMSAVSLIAREWEAASCPQ